MAKTSKEKSPKLNTHPGGRNLKHEFWGIFFVFLGAFSLLSLFSYNHADPSLFSHTSHAPANFGGKIGANVAEILVQFAGLSSFVFSFLCFAFAGKLFEGATFKKLFGNFLWILLAVLAASTFMSLQFGSMNFGGTLIPTGGVFGGWIAKGLRNYLNFWGASLFTFSALLVALVFSTPFSAAKFFKFTVALLTAIAVLAVGLTRKLYVAIRDSGVVQSFIQKQFAKKKIAEVFEQKLKEKKPEPVIDLSNAKEVVEETDGTIEAEAVAIEKPEAKKEKVRVIEAKKDVVPKKEKKPKAIQPHVGNYTLPPIELLNEAPPADAIDKAKLQQNLNLLSETLNNFDIEATVEAVRPGPVITMYEVRPGAGVKASKLENLSDDLAMTLAAQSIRVIAPIPGKSVVGIEIPNEKREKVCLREVLDSDTFADTSLTIPIAIGKDIAGNATITDLAKMPHLLVAGSSGTGKSVFINSLICSILYRFTPNDLRLIMFDPKVVELKFYEKIPHLLLPIVDDPRKASTALKWAVNEMERRYKIMAKCAVRNIQGYNEKLAREGDEKLRDLLCGKDESGMPKADSLAHLMEHDERGLPKIEKWPFIMIVIDEFADLMAAAKKDVEESVMRLAAKARAAGIHLVIATQRPSVDVVTGVLKANLQTRVAFRVASQIDSRTILDSKGAEKLLGNGDMLYIPPGTSQTVRAHGAYVSEDEVTKICEHWSNQGAPIFKEEILQEEEQGEFGADGADGPGDPLYNDAIEFVRETGKASASMLQRRFKVGYNRAARMIESMEMQGIVGPSEGAKPREVIM